MKKLKRAGFFLLCFVLLLLCSCSKNAVQTLPETVIKTVTDTNGKTYKAVVDENGFIMCDSAGKMIITAEDEKGNPLKNEQGEYVTQKVSFPNILVGENEIHTEFYKLPIPQNWQNKSTDLVKLSFTENGKTAEITVNERGSMSSVNCVKEIEDMLSVLGEVKKNTVDFNFATATGIELEDVMTVYVFSVEGRTYFVKITAEKEMFEKINFTEIVNTIKFRKGE